MMTILNGILMAITTFIAGVVLGVMGACTLRKEKDDD